MHEGRVSVCNNLWPTKSVPFIFYPLEAVAWKVAHTSPTVIALLSVMPQVWATNLFFKLVAHFISCGMDRRLDKNFCITGEVVGHVCVPLRSKEPSHRPLSLHVGDPNIKGAATRP